MYANFKRFDEAVAALKKLLQLNPNAEDAKAMLRDIEKKSEAVALSNNFAGAQHNKSFERTAR